MRTVLRITLKLLVLLCLFVAGAALFTVRPFVWQAHDPSVARLASPERIRDDVSRIVTTWGARPAEASEKLSRMADDMVATLRRTNTRVSLQTFFVSGVPFQIILAEHGHESKAGTVVLGAHYDTAPGTPGADDNTSGVAALLELNRLFADHPPPVKVILAFYPLEELPASQTQDMGSFVHASQLRRAGENVQLMVSLESIGYFSASQGSQRYPLRVLRWLYPSNGNFLAIVGEASLSAATLELKRAFSVATNLEVKSINAPRALEGVSLSDHRSFWLNGFDAVMLTDTAMFRNPHYHQPSDTAETIDADKIAQAVDGLMFFIAAKGRS